jgi:hypothetical protein
MKATETYLILCKMDAGKITLQEAHEEILRLFSVVGRSEQLPCEHPYSEVYQSETECYCEKCGKDLTEEN